MFSRVHSLDCLDYSEILVSRFIALTINSSSIWANSFNHFEREQYSLVFVLQLEFILGKLFPFYTVTV